MPENKHKISNGVKKVILTGDRPTGPLHLGHFKGSLENRVRLQDEYTQYVIIADMQALTDNAEHPEKVSNNVLQVALDNLAAGIDPKRTTIFIQSMVPALSELTMYFLNLVTLGRAKQNPTVKDEMKQKGFTTNVPLGFLSYPISQAADILAFKADVAPVGADQLPVIEQTNEIVEKFNRIYAETFRKVEPLVSDIGARLPGIDGKAKMSKSLNNAIYLSDDDKTIEKKVMLAYTDPGHIHVHDHGRVEGNVVFSYLDAFDAEKDEVADLKKQYKKGGLGDVALKKRLIKILRNVIGPIREKREQLTKDPEYVMGILADGSREAQKVAAQTLEEAKRAMKIKYF